MKHRGLTFDRYRPVWTSGAVTRASESISNSVSRCSSAAALLDESMYKSVYLPNKIKAQTLIIDAKVMRPLGPAAAAIARHQAHTYSFNVAANAKSGCISNLFCMYFLKIESRSLAKMPYVSDTALSKLYDSNSVMPYNSSKLEI